MKSAVDNSDTVCSTSLKANESKWKVLVDHVYTWSIFRHKHSQSYAWFPVTAEFLITSEYATWYSTKHADTAKMLHYKICLLRNYWTF